MSGYSQMPNDLLFDLDVPASEKVTYACLDALARNKGETRAGTSQLARMRGVSGRAIREHTADLRRRGYIEVIPQYDESGNQTISLYRLPYRQGGGRNLPGGTEDLRQNCGRKVPPSKKKPKASSEAPTASAPLTGASPSRSERELEIRARINAVGDASYFEAYAELRASWPEGITTPRITDAWTDEELDRIEPILTRVEQQLKETA